MTINQHRKSHCPQWYFLFILNPLLWRHNDRDGVSTHQPHDCLFNRLFRRRSKKTSKLRATGPCAGNLPVTGEFPAQRASKAEMFPFDDVIVQHHGANLVMSSITHPIAVLTVWTSAEVTLELDVTPTRKCESPEVGTAGHTPYALWDEVLLQCCPEATTWGHHPAVPTAGKNEVAKYIMTSSRGKYFIITGPL